MVARHTFATRIAKKKMAKNAIYVIYGKMDFSILEFVPQISSKIGKMLDKCFNKILIYNLIIKKKPQKFTCKIFQQ